MTHFWDLCPQECGLGQRHSQHSVPATSLAVTLCRHCPGWWKRKSPGCGRAPGGSQPTRWPQGTLEGLWSSLKCPESTPEWLLPPPAPPPLPADRGALRIPIFGGQEGDGDGKEAVVPFPEHFPETAASSALLNLFTIRGGPKAQLTMKKEISAPSGPPKVAPRSPGRFFSLQPLSGPAPRCSAPGAGGRPTNQGPGF